MRVLLLLTIFGTNCGETQSEPCRNVCQKEAECAENRLDPDESIPYDLDECVAACVALERDTAGKRMVEQHIKCAEKAGDSCEALMECQ